MATLLDVPKPRINCSMLSQHLNRAVCFVGRVEKVHQTGKTFTVTDGEEKTATVELNEARLLQTVPTASDIGIQVKVEKDDLPNGLNFIVNCATQLPIVELITAAEIAIRNHELTGADHPKMSNLEEELSGVVEVIGMVSNKGVIMATTYNLLREDKGIPFNLEVYNEALKVIQDFPQHYPFEVAASG